MRITKGELGQIIKEELRKTKLNEAEKVDLPKDVYIVRLTLSRGTGTYAIEYSPRRRGKPFLYDEAGGHETELKGILNKNKDVLGITDVGASEIAIAGSSRKMNGTGHDIAIRIIFTSKLNPQEMADIFGDKLLQGIHMT